MIFVKAIQPLNLLALVISMIAGICLIVNSKIQNKSMKSKKNEVKIIKTSKRVVHKSLIEAIINLQKKYHHCKSDQFNLFDSELTNILLKGEQEKEELTIEIENIILYYLTSMNRLHEAVSHFNSMTNNFTPNQLSYVLMLELLFNNFDVERNNICYCISQFDKLHIDYFETFNGTNNQYSAIVRGYCSIKGNYSAAILYYDKISCIEARKKCINSLLEFLYKSKKYNDINNIINHLTENERNDESILSYCIKTTIKLKKSNDTLVRIYNKYQKTLNLESIDLILKELSKASNKQQILSIYSSQIKHSINSYGIMMGIYSKSNDIESTRHYFNQLLSSGFKPTLAHCQLMIKTLFQCNRSSTALLFLESIESNWNISPDKAIYELAIKNCLDNKLELKAYELLMQTINRNIKLEKYNYEEVLDALNASDLKDKWGLIHKLFKVIKVSNFKRDKKLMQKLKIITEKDSSISSNDTMASNFCIGR